MSAPKHIEIASKYHNLKGKVVHHIDGDHLNNHPGNLVIMTPKGHRTIHIIMGGVRSTGRKRKRLTIEGLERLLSLYNSNL